MQAVKAKGEDSLRIMLAELSAELRQQVFTHSSWVEERSHSYERLAFLGDSVLGLAVSTELMPRFEDYSAGDLTKLRAQIVSGRSCARIAEDLNVADQLRSHAPVGVGQSVEALVVVERVLASVVEAIIGACYQSFGFNRVAPAVVGAFQDEITFAIENVTDFKSSLQEQLAREKRAVSYKVIEQSGPPHDRIFRSIAQVDSEVLGEGQGRSKKESEQEAARRALDLLKESKST